MQKNYPDEELIELQKNIIKKNQNDYELRKKPVPFSTAYDIMDPRYYAQMKNAGIAFKFLTKAPTNTVLRTKPIIKKLFDSNKSKRIFEAELNITDFSIFTSTHAIPVRFYQHDKQNRPLLIYIHGGGFFAGTIDSVNEICYSLACLGNMNVLSIDYRLSPEFKFPSAIHDCITVIDYVWNHPEDFYINPASIYLSGDSAGGNLVLATLLKEKEYKQSRISKAVLIYPVTNLASPEVGGYQWDSSYYEMKTSQKKVIIDTISLGRVVGLLVSKLYLSKDIHPTNPFVSPLLADLNDLPPLLVIYGQYDFLRIEIEALLKKLATTNTSVEAIEYLGLGHGFAEYIGTFSQTEDAFNEMTLFFNRKVD